MENSMIGKYVLITTDKDKRGVFVGVLKEDNSPDSVVLEQARMVVYYSADCHGVLGMAAIGPQAGSRISYAIPEGKYFSVTSVNETTQRARELFEAEVWDD